ncbi:DUF2732 family protein [Acerihabitans sp. TG2]|uniref:DUF2732 family protein n=1 Tax=Acerihabitans sp. TG2 TaxID=3096008 RepID=UPI002B234F9F|nr:DUF2732 family protein [Acerihabitans sp. TG2]MEA9389539.1 DUF2732 family protein [Acerihabitans sp. TG2]
MINKEILTTKIGSDIPDIDSDYTSFVMALNAARMDERRNQAALMSARLERMADFIFKHKMKWRGVTEILQQEAERIQNEALETL